MASVTPCVAPATTPCKNCNKATEKTKLCYCGSIYICSINCWKAYCETDDMFAAKCKGAMHRQKAKDYESQRKAAAAKNREQPRGTDGKFKKDPNYVPASDKTPEQQEKDNVSSAATKKKDLIKKHIRQYQEIVPENQICLRELKKRGKAEVWYSTEGYGPLQSRVKSTDTDEGESEDTEASRENLVADNPGGSASIGEEPPNLEVVQNIVQERKKITVRQFCAICNETIGKPSKRLKCNFRGCTTHSSLHLLCVGLYPTNKKDRIKIQNVYFCRDHRPETAEDNGVSPEEGSENETENDEVVPSPNDTAAKKDAAAKKNEASKKDVAAKKNEASKKGVAAKKDAATQRKRKTSSVAASTQSSKKSRKNAGKSSVSKSSTPNGNPKSKSLPSESSVSSPSIPNDQNSFPSLQSSTMPDFAPTDLTLPSSISPVAEYVTLALSADSSIASGSSYGQEYFSTDPVGQSTSQFSFSNAKESTLAYHQF